MNNITLVGRLGKDPEFKQLSSDQMVASTTMAVRKWKKEEAPDWFNIEVWGKQGKLLADYCRKGDQVAVQGRMTSETYTTREGAPATKWVVKVSNVTLVESRQDRPAAGLPMQQSASWEPEAVPF